MKKIKLAAKLLLLAGIILCWLQPWPAHARSMRRDEVKDEKKEPVRCIESA